MAFVLSSNSFGSEDLGNGVMLFENAFPFLSIIDGSRKWTLSVFTTIKHFNVVIETEVLKKELKDENSDEEQKAFITESAETFKAAHVETIMRLKKSFSVDAVQVLKTMMEEIQELRDTVDMLKEHIKT